MGIFQEPLNFFVLKNNEYHSEKMMKIFSYSRKKLLSYSRSLTTSVMVLCDTSSKWEFTCSTEKTSLFSF